MYPSQKKTGGDRPQSDRPLFKSQLAKLHLDVNRAKLEFAKLHLDVNS